MGSSSSRGNRVQVTKAIGKADSKTNYHEEEKEENHNEKYKEKLSLATAQRQDSKKFWVSHIRQRSNNLQVLQSKENKALHETKSLTCSREIIKDNQESSENTESNSWDNSSKDCSISFSNALPNNFDNHKSSNTNLLEVNSDVTNTLSQNTCMTTSSLDLEIINIYELYNYLNDGSINPCMCDPSYLLLFDARDKLSYEKLHIVSSKQSSALHSEILATNQHSYITIGNQVALDEYTFVIVYGNQILDLKDNSINEIKFLKELQTFDDVKPMLLACGFERFFEAFPFLCTQKLMGRQDLKDYKTYPSIVLIDQLFQGRGDQATNLKVIEDLKITHIVNISCEHKSAFPDRVKYLTIKLEDVSQTNLKPYFSKAHTFIDDCLKSGGRVLVHCNLGVSRSSTITISYLMKFRNWNLKTAHDFLKDKRSCIRPNRGFLQQLSSWEEEVIGERITDIDELWF